MHIGEPVHIEEIPLPIPLPQEEPDRLEPIPEPDREPAVPA